MGADKKEKAGLDVKEKALLRYVGAEAVKLFGSLGALLLATGAYKDAVRAVGVITIAVFALKAGKYLVEKATRKVKNVRAYGKWAIVTGTNPFPGSWNTNTSSQTRFSGPYPFLQAHSIPDPPPPIALQARPRGSVRRLPTS